MLVALGAAALAMAGAMGAVGAALAELSLDGFLLGVRNMAVLVGVELLHELGLHLSLASLSGSLALIFGELAVLMLLLLIVSTLSSSICLPFIFKLGVEKGRTAYYVMIGFVCGASALASGLFGDQPGAEIQPGIILSLLAAVSIGVYVLSWYMSIVFFKKSSCTIMKLLSFCLCRKILFIKFTFRLNSKCNLRHHSTAFAQ